MTDILSVLTHQESIHFISSLGVLIKALDFMADLRFNWDKINWVTFYKLSQPIRILFTSKSLTFRREEDKNPRVIEAKLHLVSKFMDAQPDIFNSYVMMALKHKVISKQTFWNLSCGKIISLAKKLISFEVRGVAEQLFTAFAPWSAEKLFQFYLRLLSFILSLEEHCTQIGYNKVYCS